MNSKEMYSKYIQMKTFNTKIEILSSESRYSHVFIIYWFWKKDDEKCKRP